MTETTTMEAGAAVKVRPEVLPAPAAAPETPITTVTGNLQVLLPGGAELQFSTDERASINEPAVKDRLTTPGVLPMATPIAESQRFFGSETEKRTRVITAAGTRLN